MTAVSTNYRQLDTASDTLGKRCFMFLAPEELKFCEQAGELWNEFLRLERMHPSELQEMQFHIHAIQHIVMARAAQRSFPDVFYQMPSTSIINESNAHKLPEILK